jgi:hypothetical protein
MIRKSVFYGLTLLLIVVLINLVFRGRRVEKQQAAKSAEVLYESDSTPTRVIRPKDLEVAHLKMRLEKNAGGDKQSLYALHEIEICNKEKTSYGKIQLSVDYLDRKGKVLATKTYSVARKLMPGDVLRLADIKIEDLPAQIANYRISIVYAEIESERQIYRQ